MKRFTLRKKITLLVVITSFALALILSFFIYIYLSKELSQQKINEIKRLSIEQTHESAKLLDKFELFIKTVGSHSRVAEYLLNPTENNANELLSNFSKYVEENNYLAIYLLSTDGEALVSTDERFLGQNYSFREYFQGALTGRSIIDVSIGKTSDQFGYYFSYPIRSEEGLIIGVLVLKIDNTEIDNTILNSEIAQSSSVMLVDRYGIVLVSNENERYLKSLGVISLANKNIINETSRLANREIEALHYNNAQKILENDEELEVFETNEGRGQKDMVVVAKITGHPFYLVSEINFDGVASFVMSAILVVVIILIIGAAIFSIFVVKTMVKIISPLKKFEEISVEISSGNFSNKVEINENNEFNDLATVFNKMIDNLKSFYEDLDNRVQNRTIDIENKSKELRDQKNAILNILEDVESEKNSVDLLAQDLQKFKMAVDNASDQVVITDPEGVVIYANKALEGITGFRPEEAVGLKAASLWKTPMPPEYYKKMWDIIKNKKKVFRGEIKNKRKNGELYDANISISPIFNSQKEIIYFVAIEHDITKEKDIDRAKSEFVSLASHQLRTPLSAINWYTEMLLSGDAGKINEEQKQYLMEVAAGNQRMVDLVDALLNVSRLDLGTFIVEPEIVNVSEIAHDVVKEMLPLITQKKLKIKEVYSKDIKEFSADKKLLRIVFQNLVSNAVKYTHNKGLITVNIAKVLKGEVWGGLKMKRDSLAISVSDSGMGIPSNQIDKIFSKMFRADNARESETEGTGLGLYIVKSIIEHSGGSAWFESKESIGSTFYVSFLLSGMKKRQGSKKLE
jgi:PAS domain S-box-containing protein